MRAVSTVVDATVCLLLVGGAVATLASAPGAVPPDGRNPAADDAELLATTTATVNYTLAPATDARAEGVTFHRTNGSDFDRAAHGTLASLLADAAVANAAVGGTRLTTGGDDYREGLGAAVRDAVGKRTVRTTVVAEWRPVPGASVAGRVRYGEDPPSDRDVHAATTTVDSGLPSVDRRAREAARRDGFRGVARVVAGGVVRGLFPPRTSQLALRADYPVDALTAQRYRRAARVLGAGPVTLAETNATRANDRLADALARTLEPDLRHNYETPTAAANAVETDAVRIVVRTWSP